MDEAPLASASVSTSAEYESLQQTAVAFSEEQATVQHFARELHDAFAAAITRRDHLMSEWREALHCYDVVPTSETLARCHVFARDLQAMDACLDQLTDLRRDVSQHRQQLRRESSRTAIRVVRARRMLDRALFEVTAVSTVSAVNAVEATEDTQSLFHDMRELLTVAVLAAGRLNVNDPTPRMSRAHAALMRSLTGLTEDLDVLDPLPTAALPRLALVPMLVPVPPVENALLPGT